MSIQTNCTEALSEMQESEKARHSKQNILKGLGCAQRVAKDLSKEREQHVNELCTPCPSEEEFLNFLDSLMNAKSDSLQYQQVQNSVINLGPRYQSKFMSQTKNLIVLQLQGKVTLPSA
ncbi:hypothetical protein TURU_031638 [Turdus rufiventris]|nr:hypothetical protein TURU_031638 [Turdus rufiventris]